MSLRTDRGRLSHKAKTRIRILDQAAIAMRENGLDGIGVSAIMARAGLTQGGFYAHFGNRDDLVAHAVDRMFQDSDRMLDRFLGDGDARAGLAALIDHYLSEETRGRAGRSCPMPSIGSEARRMPPDARQRFCNGITIFQAALVAALAAIGATEPEQLAASALSEMVGAMSLARAAIDPVRSDAILRASRDQIKRRLGLETPRTQVAESDRA